MSTKSDQQKEPVWDGNKVEMISENLSPGVYAFYDKNARELNRKGGAAGTSGGLIIGERGCLLIETLLNKRLNLQIQELTRKLSNNKTILFAVNTSAHGDHWYGNMYLPSTTSIIQHENAKKYIDEHLDHDKQFMIENFGKGRGIEEIRPRTGNIIVEKGTQLRFDIGGKFIEIIDFGFSQTGGDLFVWEPQSKVLWTGNAIVASKPCLPWLLDGHINDTLETFIKVYQFLPSDARIIPGHGVMMQREDLQWHIDYLNAVKTNVQKGINQGLNQEQTIKQTNDEMKDFRGYVLFDWIHSALNVPKAYEELKSIKK